MPTRCDHCGDESTLDSAFYRAGRRWTPGLCPACRERQRTKYYAIGLALYFAAAVGFGVFAFHRGDETDRSLAVGFALLIPYMILSTLLHELGHAVGALCAGVRLFSVCLGALGPVVAWVQPFGYDIVVRAIPLGGYTHVALKTLRFARWRYVAMIIGGPLSHVIGIAVALLAASAWPKHVLFVSAMLTCVAVDGLMLLISLWPGMHWINQRWTPSDGLQLLTIHRREFTQMHADCFYLEGLESRERGKFDASRAWFEQGLAMYPRDVGNRLGLGLAHLDSGRYAEARRYFLELSYDETLPFESQVVCRNNLAWTNLLLGDAALRPEAERLSKQAFETLPWVAAVRGTRGSVLVELGELDAGIKLLERAFAEHRDDTSKALNAAYIARALARQGLPQEAERRLQQARKLDSKCPLLDSVELEIAERKASAAHVD